MIKKDFEWARKETLKKIKQTLGKNITEREDFWFEIRYKYVGRKTKDRKMETAIRSCAFCWVDSYFLGDKTGRECKYCPVEDLCNSFQIEMDNYTAFDTESLKYYYNKLKNLDFGRKRE